MAPRGGARQVSPRGTAPRDLERKSGPPDDTDAAIDDLGWRRFGRPAHFFFVSLADDSRHFLWLTCHSNGREFELIDN